MKEKGFTLIELLAVIVILAIIALIAIPVILGIINNVQEESNKRSIEMYADAIKNAVVKHQLTSTDKIIGKFDSQNNGKELIQEGKTPVEIDYDGNVECETIEIYVDGTIYLANCKVNSEDVDYTYGKNINSSITNKIYANGDIVYFDVMLGKGCKEEEYKLSYDETKQDYLNSITGYNGIIVDENEDGKDDLGRNSCLKFYAFLDDGSDKINLLLDHNTTAKLAWTTSGIQTNENGPIDVINSLYNDTKEWKGTITPTNYEYKGTERPYTIDYSEYKARLITAQEIAKITGADKEKNLNWKEETTTGGYFLDGEKGTDLKWQTQISNSTNLSDYYWLFDRTSSCIRYGCLNNSDSSTNGYWTASGSASYSTNAWRVSNSGFVNNNYIYVTSDYGVRPVITISKSNLLQAA